MVTKLKIAIIAGVAIAAIVGITLGIVYGTRSDDDEDVNSCSKFNAPILEINVIDDRLVATWTEPDNLKDCSVTYNLKYTIDGGTQVSKELEETQFKFVDLELEPCTEVYVILTAVNEGGDESDQTTETFRKEVDTEFAGVFDLTIGFTGGLDILAKWIGVTGFEKCDLKYKVTVDKETTIVDGLEHAATLEYCVPTAISVVPVIGGVEGILKSEEVTINVEEGFVSIHEMEMERFDVYLDAIWETLPGFEACHIFYRASLNDGEERDTPSTEIRFDLPEETCVDHTIKVTPMVGFIRGTSLSETVHIGVLEPEFGAVSELTITLIQGNQVSVNWVGPTGFEECTMKYKVTVGEGDPTIVDGLEYTGTVKYCTTTIISVVPVIGDVDGTPEEQDITPTEVLEGFAGVEDWSITHTYDNQVLVKWSPLTGFDKCNLLYKVSIVGGLVITLEDQQYTAILVYCHPTTIHLVPIIGGVEGIRAEKTGITVNVSEGFADVSYLRITPIEDKNVLVTWYRPISYSECIIRYKVTVDGGTSAIVDEPEYVTSLDYCVSKIIEVVPVVDEVYGIPMAATTFGIYPESIGHVSALATEIQGNIVKATWSKPSDFERCALRYIVELKQGSSTIASSTIEDTIEWTYDVDDYCPGEAMDFTIKASYSYLPGELASVTQVCSD